MPMLSLPFVLFKCTNILQNSKVFSILIFPLRAQALSLSFCSPFSIEASLVDFGFLAPSVKLRQLVKELVPRLRSYFFFRGEPGLANAYLIGDWMHFRGCMLSTRPVRNPRCVRYSRLANARAGMQILQTGLLWIVELTATWPAFVAADFVYCKISRRKIAISAGYDYWGCSFRLLRDTQSRIVVRVISRQAWLRARCFRKLQIIIRKPLYFLLLQYLDFNLNSIVMHSSRRYLGLIIHEACR